MQNIAKILKKIYLTLKPQFFKIMNLLKNKLHNLIDSFDNVKVVKGLAYINLIIMFLNFISYFLPYKLLIIHPSLHYWFFVFSSVVILRYVQKNWYDL